jgi:DNA-directed RNA polymerase sigma subunit (sigma70/sigma32)
MIDSLREASKGLTERERQVLATNLLEPGVSQPGQLEQVSEMLGLSKQRVTEIRRTIRRKLKPALGMAA